MDGLAEAIPLPEGVVRTRTAFMPVPVPIDGDPEVGNMLWLHAVYAEARRRGIPLDTVVDNYELAVMHGKDGEPAVPRDSCIYRPRWRTPPPDPALAQNPGDLIRTLRQLRRWAGNPQPTLREIEQHITALGRSVSRPTPLRVHCGTRSGPRSGR